MQRSASAVLIVPQKNVASEFWALLLAQQSLTGRRCSSSESQLCRSYSQRGFSCCSALHHERHFLCGCVILTTPYNSMTFTPGSVSPRFLGNGMTLSHRIGAVFRSTWRDWACVAYIVQHVPPSGAVGQIACILSAHVTETLPEQFGRPRKFAASAVHIRAVVSCRLQLAEVGHDCPDWLSLLDGLRPRQVNLDEVDTGVPTHGWQFFAAEASERHFRTEVLWPRLAQTQQALMRSQSGPFVGLPFLAVPSSPLSRFPPQLFRLLLLRRLWLPLPLSSRTCRWPPTRRPWPPPRNVLEGRCLG